MDKIRPKKILIRATNWIGDAVLATPAIASIGQTFPGARITVLAKPAVAELFFENPFIHEIMIYQDRGRHRGILGKLRLVSDLREKRFDLAILLQNAFEAALLAFLAGIPQRYGYATDGRAWLLTHPVPLEKETREKHQLNYYLDLLQPLGVTVSDKKLVLVVTSDEERAAWDRLKQYHIQRSDLIIGINPGSTYGTAKRWAPERFAELAERLMTEQGAKVLIFGGREEVELVQEICDRMKQKPIQFTGQTSIRQLMALIKQCRLFITNDTGPMHIANALGIPVAAIFGSTNPKTTSPSQPSYRLVRKGVSCSPCLLRTCPIDHRCMDWITVDEVYWAAKQELADGKPLPIAVFLDRDGTLNTGEPYLDNAEHLRLFDGVGSAIARLNAQRLHAVMVTNQSGIARDYFTENSLNKIHQKLEKLLLRDDAHLDGIYYCPHHPEIGAYPYRKHCNCRKPGTGLLEQAAQDLGIRLSNSYMIGDRLSDLEAGKRVGAKLILVLTGHGEEEQQKLLRLQINPAVQPDYIAANLQEAVDWIIEDVQTSLHERVAAGGAPRPPATERTHGGSQASAVSFLECGVRTDGAAEGQDPPCNNSNFKRDPERILILKPSSLGDIIHSLPTLAAIRERFPKAFIGWLVKQEWAGILEGHPCLDELLSFSFKLSSVWPMIREIRKRRFDLILDLQGLLRTGLLGYFSRAAVRIGFEAGRELSPLFYTHRVKVDENSLHAVDRYLLIASALGAKTDIKRFDIPLTDKDRSEVQKMIGPVCGDKPMIAIHVSARQEVKRWPIERFSQVADRIQQAGWGMPVFIGASDDVPIVAEVQKRMQTDSIDLAGQTSLKELAALLRVSRLLITNDSGPMHLAAAVGTPVVALFGPTDPRKIGPYGKGHVVLQQTEQCPACRTGAKGPHRCLEAISVWEVMEAVNNVLHGG